MAPTTIGATAQAFLLAGEAPLARPLGYARWLRELTATAGASLSLSRYLPVIDDGPDAAWNGWPR